VKKWGSESELNAELRRLTDEVCRARTELERLTNRTHDSHARARKPQLIPAPPVENERRARLLTAARARKRPSR
jgi:hypothetical protein